MPPALSKTSLLHCCYGVGQPDLSGRQIRWLYVLWYNPWSVHFSSLTNSLNSYRGQCEGVCMCTCVCLQAQSSKTYTEEPALWPWSWKLLGATVCKQDSAVKAGVTHESMQGGRGAWYVPCVPCWPSLQVPLWPWSAFPWGSSKQMSITLIPSSQYRQVRMGCSLISHKQKQIETECENSYTQSVMWRVNLSRWQIHQLNIQGGDTDGEGITHLKWCIVVL